MADVKLEKLASNLHVVTLPDRTELAFSYETCIAYRHTDTKWLWQCSENVWSSTTGKHLNMLSPYKDTRLPYDIFTEGLELAIIAS